MRLFLGFAPDSGEGRAVYSLRERLSLDDQLPLRWVPPENWHLTLAFLGEVGSHLLGELVAMVQEGLSEGSPCLQGLDRLSWFPAPEKARMLVVEGDLEPPLESLHRSCVAALRSGGFAVEKRRFRPHLTLARYRGARRKFSPPALPPIRGIELSLEHLTLYESRPGERAPVYVPLHHFELGQ